MKQAVHHSESPSRVSQSRITTGPVATRAAGPSIVEQSQQQVGNQVLQQHFIQAKMTVSQPGDPFEKEADQVAEQVMRKPENGAELAISPVSKGIHRKCTKCEEDDDQQGSIVQPKREASANSGGDKASVSLASKGQPLASSVRRFFEPRFGYDFSNVRVHTDFSAQSGNQKLRAKAFTLGNNIAFNQGQYSPHSDTGKTLLAHELTHVVQQSGGHHSAPMLQANGGEMTPEGLAAIQAFINNSLMANPDPQTATANPGMHSQLQWPLPDFAGTGVQPAPSILGNWHELPGSELSEFTDFSTYRGMSDPRDIGIPTIPNVPCPSSCHQIAQSHARYAQERMAAQQRRERLARWSGMHYEQHGEALGKQASTLEEDLNTSEMASMQMRMQLFDSAVEAGSSDVSKHMRDKWAAAQQASLFLEMLFRDKDSQIPDEMLQPIRQAYQDYFTAMTAALQELDQTDRQLDAATSQSYGPCPSCHSATQPSMPGFTDFGQFDSLFPEAQPTGSGMPEWINQLTPAEPMDMEPLPYVIGKREVQLGEAGRLAASASDHGMWHQVIAHFRWATNEMDQVLVAAAPKDKQTQDLVKQFDYTRALLARQRKFFNEHPNAIKVQAIFYPKPETVSDLGQRDGSEGNMEDYAKGIPWQFYLTHTPLKDSQDIPVGFEWQLHDITAAKRSNRTVKVSEKMSNIERNFRFIGRQSQWLNEPDSILKTNPSDELFNKLDHKDFFPEGHLYWQYPSFANRGAIKTGDVQTNASRTFWEWVGLIGMSVAILGSLVFAPFSTPMLIAVAAGTGLSVLGNYMRLQEMQEHGVATERDVNQFYWSLALDIMSALTLGMGRVAATAARAGNAARATTTSRYWFMLERAELGMNVVNVGVVAHDFVQQYRAIERSKMSPEEKRKALQQLTMFGLLGGALSMVPVATGMRDLRRGSILHLDVDPQNPGRTLGRVDADSAEDLQHFRSRPRDENATPVGEVIRGQNLNAKHTYRLWSDGRITRCSDSPCPDIAESIIFRTSLLRSRMLTDSANADALQDMAEQARRLHLDATTAADTPGGLSASSMADLQRRTRELDDAMALLERDVTTESLARVRADLSNPGDLDRLLARELPDDIMVDFGGMLSKVARAGDYDPEFLQRMVTVLTNMEPRQLRNLLDTNVQVNLNPNSKVFHTPESIYWGRLGNSEEVTLLEAQLRGYGMSQGATRRPPRTGAGTPGATLDEFSDPGGQHGITSLIGDPMPRQGFENILPSRGQVQNTELKQSLDIMVSERLHAIGAGFGAESGTGIAHGSSFINQFLQNKGVEDLIRFLHARRPDGIRYIVHVDVRTLPVGGGETRMLKSITYKVTAVEELATGGFKPLREMFQATITHPEDIRAATRSRGKGDIQGIGIEVETGFGQMAEHFGL